MNRFDIWMANIPEGDKHIQYGCRPVIIVSNDAANQHSPIITVVPLTSKIKKMWLPTHIPVKGCGLTKESVALCESILSINKERLMFKIGEITSSLTKQAICCGISVQLGIINNSNYAKNSMALA